MSTRRKGYFQTLLQDDVECDDTSNPCQSVVRPSPSACLHFTGALAFASQRAFLLDGQGLARYYSACRYIIQTEEQVLSEIRIDRLIIDSPSTISCMRHACEANRNQRSFGQIACVESTVACRLPRGLPSRSFGRIVTAFRVRAGNEVDPKKLTVQMYLWPSRRGFKSRQVDRSLSRNATKVQRPFRTAIG